MGWRSRAVPSVSSQNWSWGSTTLVTVLVVFSLVGLDLSMKDRRAVMNHASDINCLISSLQRTIGMSCREKWMILVKSQRWNGKKKRL